MKTFWIVLIVVVVLVASGWLFYSFGVAKANEKLKEQDSKIAQMQKDLDEWNASINPLTFTASDLSNWTIYENKDSGYLFKYLASDWVVSTIADGRVLILPKRMNQDLSSLYGDKYTSLSDADKKSFEKSREQFIIWEQDLGKSSFAEYVNNFSDPDTTYEGEKLFGIQDYKLDDKSIETKYGFNPSMSTHYYFIKNSDKVVVIRLRVGGNTAFMFSNSELNDAAQIISTLSLKKYINS